MTQLSFSEHNRFFNDCKYIYPVLSRRSQGVSLGVNLNLNNTCNWKCIYCQVDGLKRGTPEAIDLIHLEQELDKMLTWIIDGDFLDTIEDIKLRRLNDICLAGNGEPTLSPNFVEACQIIAKARTKFNLHQTVKTILITNGSQTNHDKVQTGLDIIAQNNGEIWFKIDRITPQAILATNQVHLSVNQISRNLIKASKHCKTFIQSCWFNNNDSHPDEQEIMNFVNFVTKHQAYFEKILLYSVARNTAQEEGKHIKQFTLEDFKPITKQLEQNQIDFLVYP